MIAYWRVAHVEARVHAVLGLCAAVSALVGLGWLVAWLSRARA